MNKFLFLISFFLCSLVFSQAAFPQNIVTDDSYGILSPSKVLARDFDNDGKVDVLAVSISRKKIAWLKNEAINNGFRHPQTIYINAEDILNIESKDLTGDGILDIVFSANNGLFMMKGTGAGFSLPIQLVNDKVPLFQIEDIDGDGDLDIYWHQPNGAYWKKNDGSGSFSAGQTVFTSSAPTLAVLKDLDNDNKPDLITKSGYKMFWYKNDGLGNFTLKQTVEIDTFGPIIQAADVDNDGDTDILLFYDDSVTKQLVWYSNLNGAGNFSTKKIISNVPYNPANAESYLPDIYRMKMFDIDQDNIPDLVFSVYWDGKIYWKKNLGSGNFGPDQLITNTAKGIRDFDVSDFNNDSRKDIVGASIIDQKVAWYENTSVLGVFSTEKILTQSIDGLSKVEAGDIDGDGDIDILASSRLDGKISWYPNQNGLGDFSGMQRIVRKGLDLVKDASLVDIDGDGDKDILATYKGLNSSNQVYYRAVWFENTGNGNFPTEHIIVEGPKEIFRVGFADFDHDGDKDVVAASADNTLVWYKNNGSGVFTSQVFSAVEAGKTPLGIRIDDLDGDGDADILLSFNNKEIEWYENTDGLGSFTTKHVVINQMHNPREIYSDDLDGDGDKDILFVNYFQNEIGWFENLDGQGNYGPKKIISSGAASIIHPKSVFAFDMDGDGFKDVITNSNVGSKLRWFKNNGNGTFGAAALITNKIGAAASITAADLNADGVPELIAGSDFGDFSYDEGDNMITWFGNYTSFQNKTKGKIRYDIDNNGCDANDTTASMIMVSTQNSSNTYSTFTNADGDYSIIANQGQFTTFIASSLPNYTVTPQNHSFNFTTSGVTDTADFCIVPNQVYKDLEVIIYPLQNTRPGFNTKYKMIVTNKGTQKVSGQVSFVFNGSKMSFLGSSSAPSSQTNGNVTFDYQNLPPFHNKSIDLNFNIKSLPVNNIGDQINVTGTAGVPGDPTPEDNEFTLNQTIVGSFDPNDITVLEGPQILLQDADQYLHYIIRFQNTGNYYAERVSVKNILDDKLDWSTLTLESYSHSNEVKITNGNNVEFNFNAIYLPGSNDEPNSHGFIAYKIKPRAGVQMGDILNNKADIYFDYNPAVVTNTIHTKIIDQVLNTNEILQNKVKLYPNPTTGIISLSSKTVPEKIEIYNSLGQKLKTFQKVSTIDISHLPAGLYMLNVYSKEEGLNTFKVMKN